MNKTIFLLFGILLLLNNVFAADIAYIVKDTGVLDANIVNSMTNLGYSYDAIDDGDIATTNFSEYGAIVVGNEKIANAPVESYKSIVVNTEYTSTWSSSFGSTTSTQTLHAFNIYGNDITNGIGGDFKAYTSAGSSIPIYYLSRSNSGVSKVTVTVTSTGPDYANYAVATKEGPRRVFFGITKTQYWTPETKKLFENSLQWLFYGSDKDGDGYPQEQDCNDNDDTIWQYLKAYVDDDFDGYGMGNLVDVCSGTTLPDGYSNIAGDCDDSDFELWGYLQGYVDDDFDGYGMGNLVDVCSGDELSYGYSDNNIDCDDEDYFINIDAEDIPYDEIDQNCDGYDMLDVDEDGYCNAGALIIDASVQCPKEIGLFGTDCDDEDSEVNPGSLDIFGNCVNYPPVVENIEKIIVSESENAVVTINAEDDNGDLLEYSIDDDRFYQDDVNENVFIWETDYGDEGSYSFEASVSDGIATVSKTFEVQVNDKNIAPVCDEISEQDLDEDETLTLDINDYCYDDDEDELSVSVSSATENSHINVSIDNGVIELLGDQDWSGEEWIIFNVTDGKDSVETNKIILTIYPVEDAPVFNGTIENINWSQDNNLLNVINLNDYFYDIDSNIIFSVFGNNFIEVIINNGLVSFYPESDWFGQENITFSAEDDEYIIDSNPVSLNVNYVNKAPVFEDLNCTTDLLEDTSYNCELSATDIENDSLIFSIVENNDLNCSITGNTLNYIGNKNYFGTASCKIRVSDNYNHDDSILETEITNVNDAPIIADYLPKNVNKILADKDYRFSISPFDIDSDDLITDWVVNNEGNNSTGFGNSYIFNKPRGNYQISTIVSDEEYNVSRTWNIIAANMIEFSCSEIQGFVCNVNQTCSQSFLGVYDSERCCPVVCTKTPPQFKAITNISATSNRTNSLMINIITPEKNQNFTLGNNINVRIDVENKLSNSDIDSKLEVYLYDLTKERVIVSKKESYKLIRNTLKTIYLDMDTSEQKEINEDNEYAIFARIIASDSNNKYYNQNYTEINLDRNNHEVIIQKLDIIPESGVLCGDYININVDMRNLGNFNENIILSLESSELKLNQNTSLFNLEKFDGDDQIEKKFSIKIPENTKTGEYTIRAKVSFTTNTVYLDKKINVECKQETTEIVPVETIKLASQEPLPMIPAIKNSKIVLFLVLNSVMITLVMIVLVSGVIYRNRAMRRNMSPRKARQEMENIIKKIKRK